MGFLETVYTLGKIEAGSYSDPKWSDIDNYLTLPLQESEDQSKSGRIIRVWLEVEDPFEEQLKVKGINKIDLIDFLAGEGSLQEKRRKYLYKDPVGNNVSWSYSPIYKLGKPNKSDREKLQAEVEWQGNKKSRFFKLHNRVLASFEEEGVFSEGSVDLIMKELVDRRSELCDLWSDSKRSYILMFGCCKDGSFMYPGEIPAFVAYFRKKLEERSSGGNPITCAFCGERDEIGSSFSDVFKFATFDKASFLPGNSKNSKGKVFPICRKCNALFTKGRDVLRSKFTNRIAGINMDVVPEFVFGKQISASTYDMMPNFIRTGLKIEEKLFSFLAQQEESLVFHFMFWEKNNAQERVHLLVEDVPPTRLKRLQNLWRKSLEVYPAFAGDNTSRESLDFAIENIVQVYKDLSSHSDSDKKFQMNECFKLLGRLLNGNKIDARSLKTSMVARFPRLFASDDWPRKGASRMIRMLLVLDFVERTNGKGR